MEFGKPKLKMPGKFRMALILLNLILLSVVIYEGWFLKDLYSTLAGQFDVSGVNLRVARVNLETYHNVENKYNDLVNYKLDQKPVNNPFGK